jgi:hypothetical protein
VLRLRFRRTRSVPLPVAPRVTCDVQCVQADPATSGESRSWRSRRFTHREDQVYMSAGDIYFLFRANLYTLLAHLHSFFLYNVHLILQQYCSVVALCSLYLPPFVHARPHFVRSNGPIVISISYQKSARRGADLSDRPPCKGLLGPQTYVTAAHSCGLRSLNPTSSSIQPRSNSKYLFIG